MAGDLAYPEDMVSSSQPLKKELYIPIYDRVTGRNSTTVCCSAAVNSSVADCMSTTSCCSGGGGLKSRACFSSIAGLEAGKGGGQCVLRFLLHLLRGLSFSLVDLFGT